MVDFNYNYVIEYIDGTRDLNFEAARKWAREHNVTFGELIDQREEKDGKLYRYFQIGVKPQPHIPTEEEIKAARITELKANLASTDYTVIKIAEGAATPEEYADVIAQRQAWRAEINELS